MRLSRVVALAVFGASVCFPLSSIAEETKKQTIEEMVEKPSDEAQTLLKSTKRTKLTEEQATNQLKYMMVKGWERVERDLVEKGSFKPMGMILRPDGEFRPIRVDRQDELKQEVALEAIVRNLKAFGKSRQVWGVGMIWVTGKKLPDGNFYKQIMVTTEHIAGWGRHWAYPYKVVDGEVKLGQPVESPTKLVYFR